AIEVSLAHHLALVLGRPPDDELDDAVVLRRTADMVEPGVKIPGRQMRHPSMMHRIRAAVPPVVRHICGSTGGVDERPVLTVFRSRLRDDNVAEYGATASRMEGLAGAMLGLLDVETVAGDRGH